MIFQHYLILDTRPDVCRGQYRLFLHTYVSVKVAVTATKFCVLGPMAMPFVLTSGNALGL